MSIDTNIDKSWSSINDIKKTVLPLLSIEDDIANYRLAHIQIAQLYYYVKEYEKTVYHLSECHGTLLRRYAILEDLRKEGCFGVSIESSSIKWEYLSQTSEYAKQEEYGLLRRLSEMPQEWTIVQLTRIPEENEVLISQNGTAPLKHLFISRMQCGPNSDELLVDYNNLPNVNVNILAVIDEAASKLSSKGLNQNVVKARKQGSEKIEEIIKHLDDDIFMDWKCLFLGKLGDKMLQNKIRNQINNTLAKHQVELSSREKTLLYLIAEGVCFFDSILVKSHITQKLTGTKLFKKELHSNIMNLPELFPELREAKRHPIILIIEDHLEIVPWENMPILKDQAVSRVPSIQILHALFKAHEKHIHHGLREISEGKINCYILNPDSDLATSEARMKPFFEARLPNWQGVVGKKPTPNEMTQLVSSSNSYMYCGHGSGVHLLNGYTVQQMNLKNSVQFLFGCKSAALKYLGGVVPMMGDMLHYCIAGSACSIGMLYVVLNDDVDKMTAHFTNMWLPGTPIDFTTLNPICDNNFRREPELLRVLPKVRQVVNLASNGLAFIARGLPVKLVPSSSH